MLSRAHVSADEPAVKPVVGEDRMPVFPKEHPIDLRRNVSDDGVYHDLVGVGRYHVRDG